MWLVGLRDGFMFRILQKIVLLHEQWIHMAQEKKRINAPPVATRTTVRIHYDYFFAVNNNSNHTPRATGNAKRCDEMHGGPLQEF